MLSLALAGALAASNPGAKAGAITDLTCGNLDGARIVSQEDAPVYLGFFGGRLANDSIYNTLGPYGSNLSSTSVRNNLGRYGSSTSAESAQNNLALRPPLIVRDGFVVGILTTNSLASARSYSASIPRVTLAEIDATCSFTSTSPGRMFNDQTGAGGLDASVSGFWWNTNRSGEGLLLEFGELNGAPYMFAVFFAYDPNTRAPVFIAGGSSYSRSSLGPITAEAILSSGGSFGPNFNPGDIQRQLWGTLSVTVNTCNSATLTYDSVLPGYGSGSIELQRFLDRDAYTTCP